MRTSIILSILISAAFSNQFDKDESPTIEEGLIGYYPFPNSTYDYSGNDNNGTAFGGGYTVDRFGNSNSAFIFDGESYIEIPEHPDFETNAHTIAIWVKASAYSYGDLFSKDGECHSRQWLIGIPAHEDLEIYTRVHVWASGTIYYFDSDSHFPPDEWVFLAQVWDGSFLKLFINGILDNEIITGPNLAEGEEPIRIGGGSAVDCSINYNFTGTVDDIRFYNRALSSEELNLLYSENSPLFGCADPYSINFTPDVLHDHNLCVYPILGDADNDTIVTILDLVIIVDWIIYDNPEYIPFIDLNFDEQTNILDVVVFVEWLLYPYLVGCTDPLALNYNPDAIYENGSCNY